MILLDTNIISALMQPEPTMAMVVDWFNRQQQHQLYVPSIVIAEVTYGLQLMPLGKRQTLLLNQFHLLMADIFAEHIFVFGQYEAEAYALLRAQRDRQGRPMSMADAQIAAIAQVHHLAIATRNIKDFEGCGLRLINPFDE